MLAAHAASLSGQARKILEQRLEQDPENGKLWYQLADCCRAAGDVMLAIQAYQNAAKQEHNAALANYCVEIFQANEYSKPFRYPEAEFLPVPYIRRFDFLTQMQLQQVWSFFDENQDEFVDSRVGAINSPIMDKDKRMSQLLGKGKCRVLHAMIQPLLQPVLDQAYRLFGITPPEHGKLTLQMTSHANAEFYRIHSDSGPQFARLLSYIYYFHTEPKYFTGGELQLYDSCINEDTYSSKFTSIVPLHNSLIVFPSEYYHQVCTVHLTSQDRRNGRNTLNGWHIDRN